MVHCSRAGGGTGLQQSMIGASPVGQDAALIAALVESVAVNGPSGLHGRTIRCVSNTGTSAVHIKNTLCKVQPQLRLAPPRR